MGWWVTRLRTVPCTEEGGSAARAVPSVDCAFAWKQNSTLERSMASAKMPRRDLVFGDANECLAERVIAWLTFAADYCMSKPLFLEGLVAEYTESAASVGFSIPSRGER